jgi:hypothetical protein
VLSAETNFAVDSTGGSAE